MEGGRWAEVMERDGLKVRLEGQEHGAYVGGQGC